MGTTFWQQVYTSLNTASISKTFFHGVKDDNGLRGAVGCSRGECRVSIARVAVGESCFGGAGEIDPWSYWRVGIAKGLQYVESSFGDVRGK